MSQTAQRISSVLPRTNSRVIETMIGPGTIIKHISTSTIANVKRRRFAGSLSSCLFRIYTVIMKRFQLMATRNMIDCITATGIPPATTVSLSVQKVLFVMPLESSSDQQLNVLVVLLKRLSPEPNSITGWTAICLFIIRCE